MMSLSSISRAKVDEARPRLLGVKSMVTSTPEGFAETDAPDPELEWQSKLAELRQELMNLEQEIEQKKQVFQNELDKERHHFQVTLAEERKQTIEESFNEGFAQGEQAGRDAWQEKLKEANAIIEKAEREADVYIQDSEVVILQLALAVAEKVIGQMIDQNDEAWVSLVKQAIKVMREDSPIKIIVSPEKYEETFMKLDEIREVTHGSQVLIYTDDSMKDFECRIESPSGRLDAGVDTQINQLEKGIKELMGLT